MSEHYLIFSAAIDARTCSVFVPHLVELQLIGATKLTIAISSPGGNVVSGITMFNAMLAMPYEITTHNFGNVDSIANALFLGGSIRHASPTSTFMFHGVSFDGNANERLEEKNLLEKLDVVRAEHARISGLIASRSNLSDSTCRRLFRQQKTRSAQWAQTSGIVHELREFTVPAGANVRHLV